MDADRCSIARLALSCALSRFFNPLLVLRFFLPGVPVRSMSTSVASICPPLPSTLTAVSVVTSLLGMLMGFAPRFHCVGSGHEGWDEWQRQPAAPLLLGLLLVDEDDRHQLLAEDLLAQPVPDFVQGFAHLEHQRAPAPLEVLELLAPLLSHVDDDGNGADGVRRFD